jgi:predicted RecB family nuclease
VLRDRIYEHTRRGRDISLIHGIADARISRLAEIGIESWAGLLEADSVHTRSAHETPSR